VIFASRFKKALRVTLNARVRLRHAQSLSKSLHWQRFLLAETIDGN
jgi:hypothetical protein